MMLAIVLSAIVVIGSFVAVRQWWAMVQRERRDEAAFQARRERWLEDAKPIDERKWL